MPRAWLNPSSPSSSLQVTVAALRRGLFNATSTSFDTLQRPKAFTGLGAFLLRDNEY